MHKALEAAKILRENVVQGVMEEEGVFRGFFFYNWLVGVMGEGEG